MRNNSERIEAMHERAKRIKRAKDKRINSVLGACSALLLVGIVVFATLMGGGLHPINNIGETGSSLLDEEVGGYVLVAVTSFMVAVVVTVLCIKWNNKRKNSEDKGQMS